jgi:hypothetical protein
MLCTVLKEPHAKYYNGRLDKLNTHFAMTDRQMTFGSELSATTRDNKYSPKPITVELAFRSRAFSLYDDQCELYMLAQQ